MNYTYKIENLGCANCAAKMEAAVSKLDGVNACSVNFFAQKLKLETDSAITVDFFNKIQKIVRRIEPDVKLKEV